VTTEPLAPAHALVADRSTAPTAWTDPESSARPRSILILGSGPVIIGQAAEFDYAGTQACRALREEGVRTILLNSNPATIMTDPGVADVVYLEPLTLASVERILEQERPDGLLASLGGQTGLNLAIEIARAGLLERYDTRLLGTPIAAIEMAEDRERFRDLLDSIGQPYAPSAIVEGATEAERAAAAARALADIGLPAIVRPAYTLGGTGGGIVVSVEAFEERVRAGLRLSPIGQVMVERYLAGWQEIEYEVMRDAADTCIAVCSMENVDPLGVHTGDSIVVAPVQTLPDPVTSASARRRCASSAPSAWRAAATSSSRSRPTARSTPSSRSTRASAARRPWPPRRRGTPSRAWPPRSPSGGASTRSPTPSRARPWPPSSPPSTTSWSSCRASPSTNSPPRSAASGHR
jgi:hypothetical protein